MKLQKIFLVSIAVLFAAASCTRPEATLFSDGSAGETREQEAPENRVYDFSQADSRYLFQGEIPTSWEVAYVPATEAVNIYDPKAAGGSALEQSQIFIRFFEAKTFLTLATVDILSRESTELHGHEAARYEIRKKPQAPDFPGQPQWRSGLHKLMDVRYSPDSPSLFYVIAANPVLPEAVFDRFLGSLVFENDKKTGAVTEPILDASLRVSKKPFGLKVSPDESPVSPERFSGYHTGVDFEVFADEEGRDVAVAAACSGELLVRQEVSGYGGTAVQSCVLDGKEVTVLYGHLRLSSISKRVGERLEAGEKFAVLGTGRSAETEGERKHLHLGIKVGRTPDLRGYVSRPEELSGWLNVMDLL